MTVDVLYSFWMGEGFRLQCAQAIGQSPCRILPFRFLNSGLSRKPWSFKSLRSLNSCTVSAAVFAFLAGGGQTPVEGPAVWEEVLEVLGGSPQTKLGNVFLPSRYHRNRHRFVTGCQDKLILTYRPGEMPATTCVNGLYFIVRLNHFRCPLALHLFPRACPEPEECVPDHLKNGVLSIWKI